MSEQPKPAIAGITFSVNEPMALPRDEGGDPSAGALITREVFKFAVGMASMGMNVHAVILPPVAYDHVEAHSRADGRVAPPPAYAGSGEVSETPGQQLVVMTQAGPVTILRGEK